MTVPINRPATNTEITGGGVPRGTSAVERSRGLIPIGETFGFLGWEPTRCDVCGFDFQRIPELGRTTCPRCVERDRAEDEDRARERHSAALLRGLDERLLAMCRSAGMSKRELGAVTSSIPASLGRRLMQDNIGMVSMLTGMIPDHGFGLSGGVGVGKTFAIAAIMKDLVLARWRLLIPTEGQRAFRAFLAWSRWPEEVSAMRTIAATRESGMREASERILGLSSVAVLVIDDLGAERMRGPYDEDWCASQLDLLVDRRYNDGLPTWYTTNLAPPVFVERFGSRLYSRLCGHNPLVEVQASTDLRITTGR